MTSKVNTADVVERIKNIRESQKISQEDMAELLNMTYSNYSKIENANQNITVKHLRNICKVLRISADLLLFDESEQDKLLTFNDYLKFAEVFSDEEIDVTIKKWQKIKRLKHSDE